MNNEAYYKKALWTIMEALLETENIDEALSGSLEAIVSVMQSEAGAIWIIDKKTGFLHPVFPVFPQGSGQGRRQGAAV